MTTLQFGLKDEALLSVAAASLREAEESAVMAALRTEWVYIASTRKMPLDYMFDARRDNKGRPVFILRAQNGYHESLESYEDALRLLVESHRS